MHWLLSAFFLSMSLAPLSGCALDSAPWVEVAGNRFTVEIAADDSSRTRGLMFRDELDATRGMLFVFDREEPLAFWMKNTRIPLDILYFDSDRRFVSIAAGVPPCTTPQCPTYPSAAPSRFTLELKAGVGNALGLKRGDELLLGPSIRVAPALE